MLPSGAGRPLAAILAADANVLRCLGGLAAALPLLHGHPAEAEGWRLWLVALTSRGVLSEQASAAGAAVLLLAASATVLTAPPDAEEEGGGAVAAATTLVTRRCRTVAAEEAARRRGAAASGVDAADESWQWGGCWWGSEPAKAVASGAEWQPESELRLLWMGDGCWLGRSVCW